MTNRKIIAAILAPIALHGIALAQTGRASTTAPANPLSTRAAADSDKESRSEDKYVISRAANANNFELQLADLAAPKLNDDHLKVMVSSMRNDHLKAQRRLEEIAAAKGIKLTRGSMDEQQKRMLLNLADKNGEEFQQAYIDAEMEAHQHMVDFLQRQQAEDQNPELSQYAKSILPTLREHMSMLQQQTGEARPAGSSLTVTDKIMPGPKNENIKDRPEH